MTKTDIALLMTAATIVLIAALAGNAAASEPAAQPSCLNTNVSYLARPLNTDQLWVQNSFGKKKPALRITTSCHHLQSGTAYSLSAQFTCLSLGDPVIATIGSDRQSCVVTKVQAYVAEDGDLPEKK